METISATAPKALFGNIELLPFSTDSLAGLLLLLAVLVAALLFSGAETAFLSLEPKDQETIRSSRKRNSALAGKLLAAPGKLRTTLLVGNVFIHTAIILLSARLCTDLLNFGESGTAGLIFQLFLTGFLLLVFGEILPAKLAAGHPAAFATRFSPLVFLAGKMTSPVSGALSWSADLVDRQLTRRKRDLSPEEISRVLKMNKQDDLPGSQEILEGISRFGSTSTSEIMQPRIGMVTVDFKSGYREILETVKSAGYSRIPVQAGTPDDIRGILYIKDLLPHLSKGTGFKWQQLIRPALFVPESKKIDDLLEEFQKMKVHLAVVVDEYGGTSGLVTLEDILEEIVGDIADEFDEDEKFYTRLGPGEYLFEGKTLLHDFCKAVECEESIFADDRGDADTLAGLLLELTGEFPEPKKQVNCKNFTFFVVAVEQRRIKEIRVVVNPGPATK